MASTWTGLEHAMGRNDRTIGAEDGAVTQHHPSGGNAVHHPTNYNATDGRHSRESGLAPWTSVDVNSGEASEADFGKTGPFPDGPGPWRQT